MPVYNKEREQHLRNEIRGKTQINAYVVYELFDAIHELESDKKKLSDLLFRQEKRFRDVLDSVRNNLKDILEMRPTDSPVLECSFDGKQGDTL